ncbi:MAG TPA: 4-alpha-glucanotransferase [Steroidobacteraceae bacterium]|nr:4-alpha-glucanotransferase [Steroidobacteraceae bacterium]
MTGPPSRVLDRRRAGVLLHATSLPDASHGALGQAARSFVDWLAAGGFSVWQLLPLGPVASGGSPYYACSNHAGNPALVDRTALAEAGLIGSDELAGVAAHPLIGLAGRRLRARGGGGAAALGAFVAREAHWLADYSLFASIQAEQRGRPWWEWPEGLRERNAAALAMARTRLAEAIADAEAGQYFFQSQYSTLKDFAAARGVHLFGDIPIYPAPDSVEVWAHPELFQLDSAGRPTAVAGVPPDYFAADGQLWGNPLYRWEAHERTRFAWWIERLRAQFALFDLVRIDHFRGLESYWAIPAGARTAAAGEWRRAPGDRLLARVREVLGGLELVAEDLGVITPAVDWLRDRFGLPGMRVAQFGFGDDPTNLHLPHNWTPRSIAYTGTHDNDTTAGWYSGLEPRVRELVADYVGAAPGEVVRALMRTVLASVAGLAVLPMQDLLELGGAARMNTPGTKQGNWAWKFAWPDVPPGLAARCLRWNQLYGRA